MNVNSKIEAFITEKTKLIDNTKKKFSKNTLLKTNSEVDDELSNYDFNIIKLNFEKQEHLENLSKIENLLSRSSVSTPTLRSVATQNLGIP